MEAQSFNSKEYLLNSSPLTPSAIKIIESVDDFPAPVSGIITLAASTIYLISGNVDVGTNRFILSDKTMIKGTFPETDQITSTTTGDLLTATSASFKIETVRINGYSSTGLNINGTGAENALFTACTIVCGSLGSINNYSVFDINQGNFSSLGAGLSVTGNMFAISLQGGSFYNTSGSGLDMSTVTADILNIGRMYFNNANSTTGLKLAVNGANLNSGKLGVLENCSFLDAANGVSGYSPFDLEWECLGNNGVTDSDRLNPSGWEASFDGEITTPTIAVGNTATLLTIDGAGATSNSSYLPKSIRGTSNIWNTSTNKIEPITEGDSYDLRVQVAFSGLSGNPNELHLDFDIGGTGAPTIVIAEDTKSIKGVSEPVIFTFPFYALSTFMVNGGQMFLRTDTGTATISSRSIAIVRVSSGAS